MRNFLMLALCFLVVFSCQTAQNPKDELQNVERVVFDFFESIASFNYPALRDHCTDDFVIYEDGQIMNMHELIELCKSFENTVTLSFQLQDMKTFIEGSFAWVTLRNKGVMTMDNKITNFEWLESAVIKKEHGLWKLAFYHSTKVPLSEEEKSSSSE